MRYLLVFILFNVSASWSISQDVNEVLKKLRAKYTAIERIEYETQYELFKGHKTNEVHTSYDGYVYRSKNLMYQKIHDTELVYGADYSLKINSEEKIMMLGQKQNTLELEMNLDDFLKQCKSKSLKEMDGYYSITLIFKDDSPVPLSVVKMRVNKKDFSLQQLDLYYSDFQDFSEDYRKVDLHPSHLRIKFTKMSFTPESRDYLFLLSRYLITKKGIHTPSSSYLNFQLIDSRI